MNWFKHAFAVESTKEAKPTRSQKLVVDRLCQEVVKRRMAMPAMVFLEMSHPLNYLSSQAMHFFQPIVATIFDHRAYEQLAKFLEHRSSIDYIIKRIEHFQEKIQKKNNANSSPRLKDSKSLKNNEQDVTADEIN